MIQTLEDLKYEHERMKKAHVEVLINNVWTKVKKIKHGMKYRIVYNS